MYQSLRDFTGLPATKNYPWIHIYLKFGRGVPPSWAMATARARARARARGQGGAQKRIRRDEHEQGQGQYADKGNKKEDKHESFIWPAAPLQKATLLLLPLLAAVIAQT